LHDVLLQAIARLGIRTNHRQEARRRRRASNQRGGGKDEDDEDDAMYGGGDNPEGDIQGDNDDDVQPITTGDVH
jgi:hypothetical protein